MNIYDCEESQIIELPRKIKLTINCLRLFRESKNTTKKPKDESYSFFLFGDHWSKSKIGPNLIKK